MVTPGPTGENGKKIMSNNLKASLMVVLFIISMVGLSTVKAGNIDWSIHFDWILPPPNHGHGHGHGHGWNSNPTHVNCVRFYMSHGCNQYGYNCVRMPHSECRNGQFIGPYRPRYVDHHGTMHNHTWRCYQKHWHGNHFSHKHHADGHHDHDPHMMWNK